MRCLAAIFTVIVVLLGVLMIAVPGHEQREADLVFISSDDLHNLDPQRTRWLVDFRILECLYEPLVRFRVPQLDIEPATANRWTVSEDGRTYTFHIRPDARWSNGDPVTANDFKYAWRRALLPDFASAYTSMLFCIDGAEQFNQWRSTKLDEYARLPDDQRTQQAADKLWTDSLAHFNATVGIETPDDHTLVVRLANPTAYFLELCAFATLMPVHEASISRFVTAPNAATGIVEQRNDYFRADNLVCNGPYLLSRWRPKEDLLLLANERYWNRLAMGNRSVQMIVNDNPNTAIMQLRNGEADWWPDVPAGDLFAADLRERNLPDVHVYTACATYFLVFNCTDTLPDGSPNPFKDPRVRRAFSMTINRQAIVSAITRMNQPVARSFVPVDVFTGYIPPEDAGATFNPDAARALLAKAGYPGGKGLPPLPLLVDSNPGHTLIFQQMKNAWERELGAQIDLQVMESRLWGQMRRQGKFAIARRNWYGDYGDPTTFLYLLRSDDGNNDGSWRNDEYDQLLRKADAETDAQTRMQLLAAAERVLLNDQPVAPVYHYISMEMFDPNRVKNLHANPMKRRRIEQIKVIDHDRDGQ